MTHDLQCNTKGVHEKRFRGEALTRSDLDLLLADTLMDRGLFLSPRWNWPYGGVRYAASEPGTDPPKKILVVQWPSPLGDSAMTMKFFSVLRQRHRDSQICFLTGEVGQNLHRMNPFVDTLIHNPLDRYFRAVSKAEPFEVRLLLGEIHEFLRNLRKEKFGLLINLHILPMSAVLSKAAEPAETLGMTLSHDGMPVIRGNAWAFYLFASSAGWLGNYNGLHRSEIFRLMADPEKEASPRISFCFPPQAVDRVQAYFDSRSIGDRDFVVGMSPLSKWPSKVWPRFGSLAEELHERYKARVVFFGAPEEEEKIREILRGTKAPVASATGFSVEELLAAIGGCDLFISNDTGPMHLACALGRKVIALFGPTDLVEVGPWNTDWLALQSRRCRRCRKPVCKNKAFCMEDITTKDVMACAEILRSDKNGPRRTRGSGPVRIVSPDETPKDSLEEEWIAGAYLDFFRERTFSAEPGAKIDRLQNLSMPGLLPPFSREANAFGQLAQKGLDSLEEGDMNALRDASRAMTDTEGLLKIIEIYNSVKHVEKRAGVSRTEEMYRAYFRGVLDDLGLFLRQWENRQAAWRPGLPAGPKGRTSGGLVSP